jgi:haloalkane dehalogenase
MIQRRFDPSKKKTVRVLGATMSYVETGSGHPIVLLHGNPTSSFLWRKVIPYLAPLGRCIAPDLIGMGDSAKTSSGVDGYRFKYHREYLEAFLELIGVRDQVTLVCHDWGGALGFDWGRRHPDSVRGVAYMETIVTPLTWDDWPEAARPIFQSMRSDKGEEIVLKKNVFVERILPTSVLDPLSEETMTVYRAPYRVAGESRRPTLTWPREIPIEGIPADVTSIVEASQAWLEGSPVPKLFINAEPGSILVGRQREVCRRWPNQTEVTVRGLHFIQEDSGSQIGKTIAGWLQAL